MNANILMFFLGGIPVIAWLPARLWTVCGDPWCLKVFPDWLDSLLYSLLHHYLDDEMTMAAEQMDFLEVWISSILIIQIFTLSLLLFCKYKFTEDYNHIVGFKIDLKKD